MTSADRITATGRPPLSADHTYDVDTAQHFLSDHAAGIVVAFNHHAVNPDVLIYTATTDGTLSPGDYYLWPLLHQTGQRIRQELVEQRNVAPLGYRYYEGRRLNKWQRRITLLTTLIRIRKATIQALCSWDLTNSRPTELTVIDTTQDLTGLTITQARNAGLVG